MDEQQAEKVAEALLAPEREAQASAQALARRRREARRNNLAQRIPVSVCGLLGLTVGGVIAAQTGARMSMGIVGGAVAGMLLGLVLARVMRRRSRHAAGT